MSNDLAQLPLWVRGIAETISPANRRQVARKLGIELRKANQARTSAQTDADGNTFVAPLQAKNSPMFREITNARYFQVKPTDSQVAIGFRGSAGRIAKIHQEGKLSEVRKGSAKKYPYPVRTILGINGEDERLIEKTIRDLLLQD
ncbi:phage virion morphogenesis protein [Faucicola atlantae]|uniref:Phage virion morphogenesis protein n=1 Tax=Faucicola atlantae TaxID=34059 RepID=A0A1B8QD17_9GAMM|nr:phage virion morphogenesis protein [Moraxella atlantae]OBX79131.1 phage virion morphogenesis protein [Moraxella atlantae]